ncbi:hypothetical protein [Duganella caerulea]|uniref:hypothetical protein n=1 Tax=Duganella caerulea TaxID=2885762 RepID=UPI004037AC8A
MNPILRPALQCATALALITLTACGGGSSPASNVTAAGPGTDPAAPATPPAASALTMVVASAHVVAGMPLVQVTTGTPVPLSVTLNGAGTVSWTLAPAACRPPAATASTTYRRRASTPPAWSRSPPLPAA